MRVVKIGGRAQGDAALPGALAAAAQRGPLCIVHGGGDEVTAMQRALGREPTFVNGRRVTTADDIDVVRMVLSGTVNKRLTARFLDAGVAAVGISGEDGGLLTARLFDEGALGAVGEPDHVRTGVLDTLCRSGFVPVVSPLGRSANGDTLNINGDDAAAAIAAALGAGELLLLADVPGVLDAAGARIASLTLDQAAQLVHDGVARGGMTAKLEAARRALTGGVTTVRIGDVSAIADVTTGTTLTLSPATV